VNQHPHALLCFPSGETPTGTLQHLVEFARSGKVVFSRSRFVGLDEWVGMHRRQEGSCQHYLYTHFFDPLSIKPEQVVFFNAHARDLEKECERINHWLRTNGPIDVMLMGVGMNGHLGLNEPGTPFGSEAHTSALDPLTKTVGQKYFAQPTSLEAGITLGLKQVTEAKIAILIASGAKKASVIASAVEGVVTEQLPASILQTHPNGHLFLDEAAASQLKDKTSSV
jgi:glucosamine-6-phosphate isomerase